MSPLEGLCPEPVVALDMLHNLDDELLLRTPNTAPKDIAGEDIEPDSHLVQPE